MQSIKIKNTKEQSEKLSLSSIAYKYINTIYVFYTKNIVYRLFWGRSSLYKNFVHACIVSFTAIITISSFTSNILITASTKTSFNDGGYVSGSMDLLEQGGSVETILQASTTRNFNIIRHVVEADETFDSISDKFGVSSDRIKLSNLDVVSFYDDSPSSGVTLMIPEINGIFVKADSDMDLTKLMEKITRGDRLDIIEINNLRGPDYKIKKDDILLIPDGLIDPPPPPTPQIVYTPQPYAVSPVYTGEAFYGVSFIDPLSHPNCAGYGYSRGYSSWHNGVDLTRGIGCPIVAAASGTVEFAGWSGGGEGFMIRIGHGNGVQTLYFHGDGQIWVKPGDYIEAGTPIMNMGNTGYSFGTHLHFSLRHNYVWMDAAPYVPYWRP